MSKEKIKVYLYTRVSTTMQIDGYSLDAQKTKMKAFCDYNEYEIAGEYEDAGKSGKSIEGRIAFNQMMDDIKSGKDEVSYVLVFKLSRFGRNAADVLATLQVMQDFGVNLICVEDGIDSSKDAGKLMISVLSAVAEIERENIRVQTMEGRMQKAREGKWNGGFAPYGYALIDGKLVVNEEEAVVIRTIFDQYVNTDLGANGIAKYLENHGIHKIARQNGKNPLFDAALIRRIIQNPVYSGKISYGRRRTEKVHGTRNEYRQVKKDDYLLVDGLHEALVSEEVWEAARLEIWILVNDYIAKAEQLKRLDEYLEEKVLEVPNVEKLLAIKGVGLSTVIGFVAEIGDIGRFTNPKQIQKLAGLEIVKRSSGKKKGQPRISKRGRRKLRRTMYESARALMNWNPAFQDVFLYYRNREGNPLGGMQAKIAVACKAIRVFFVILKTGCDFDEERFRKDIMRQETA